MGNKNRLAQSGPRRFGLGPGAIVQQVTATRDASPDAAILAGVYEEVSSGASLGGTDMRPSLTPILQDSLIEVRLEAVLLSSFAGANDQPIDVSLEVSDDAGASWVIVADSEPAAVLPNNLGDGGEGGITNEQRHIVQMSASSDVATLFPGYEGAEILARARVKVDNTAASQLISEADPGNCRVSISEIVA